jgi:hypothetical protein
MRFDITAGDLNPPVENTLPGAGDLPENASVWLTLSQVNGTKRFVAQGVIDNPGNAAEGIDPVVHYGWEPGDTDTAGVYRAQWQVSLSPSMAGADPETFPSDEVFFVIIHPRL